MLRETTDDKERIIIVMSLNRVRRSMRLMG